MRYILPSLLLIITLTACSSKDEEVPAPTRQAVGVASVVDAGGADRPDFPALEYALETDPARVIPAEALRLVGGEEKYKAGIPAGADFKIRWKTWKPDKQGSGTVRIDMLVDNEVALRSLGVLLEDTRRRWFLLQTLPLDEYLDEQASATPTPTPTPKP